MVLVEGGPLVKIKACLHGTSQGQASGYIALILMLMGKNWGFPGKTISMFALENMDCFSGDLSLSCSFICYSVFLSLS